MAEILGLAVAAAFYPVLLAGVLLILSRPQPRALLLAFLIGGMTVSLLAGTLILVLADDTGALSGSSRRTVSPAVDIVVGLVSLAVAVMLWRRRDRPRKERKQPEWLRRRLGGGSPWLAFVIGVALNLPGVYYLAALKQISVGGYGTVTDALLLVVFNVIMFALVEVPLLWYVFSPDDARRRVAALDGWMHAHSSQLAVAIAAAVGVYLCAKGVGGALS